MERGLFCAFEYQTNSMYSFPQGLVEPESKLELEKRLLEGRILPPSSPGVGQVSFWKAEPKNKLQAESRFLTDLPFLPSAPPLPSFSLSPSSPQPLPFLPSHSPLPPPGSSQRIETLLHWAPDLQEGQRPFESPPPWHEQLLNNLPKNSTRTASVSLNSG